MNRLYRVKWGRLEQFDVQRETPKTLKAILVEQYGTYTHTIRRDVIGTEYYETVKAAWLAQMHALATQIDYTKQKLQQLRTAHGMAQSEANRA